MALVATLCTAGLKTYLAVALGNIFNIIADFGGGSESSSETYHHVIRWCVILVLLGLGNWIASSSFLALWIMFSELQTHEARRILCIKLLEKNMSWFDSIGQGVPSLLVQIQT